MQGAKYTNFASFLAKLCFNPWFTVLIALDGKKLTKC